jgi:lysophospholipase L1-like esterase
MEGKAISTSRNILCFGDSLTWGYIFCEPNPYSITLAKELKGKGFSD